MTGLVLFSKMDATPHCNHRSLPFCSTHRHQFLTQKKHPKQNPPSWSPSLPLHELHSHSWNAWCWWFHHRGRGKISHEVPWVFGSEKWLGAKRVGGFSPPPIVKNMLQVKLDKELPKSSGRKFQNYFSCHQPGKQRLVVSSPNSLKPNGSFVELNRHFRTTASSIRDPDALPKWRSPTSP